MSALDWNYSRYSSRRLPKGPAVLTLQTCLHTYFTLNKRKVQKWYTLLELLQESKIVSSLQSIDNKYTWGIKGIKAVHNIFLNTKYHDIWMCDISDWPNKTHLNLKWPCVCPTIQKRSKVKNTIFHLSVIK